MVGAFLHVYKLALCYCIDSTCFRYKERRRDSMVAAAATSNLRSEWKIFRVDPLHSVCVAGFQDEDENRCV